MASDTLRRRHAGTSSAAMDEYSEPSGAPSPQRRHDDSWVEVSSQPSSSSLSSIGDDMVDAGFRVASHSYPPRRRRAQQQQQQPQDQQQRRQQQQQKKQEQNMPATFIVGHPASQGGATSSQEEYDETESDEDRVMTSSTEAIYPPTTSLFRQQAAARAPALVDSDSDDDDDDDENATALGRPSNTPVFRPQPNAFSHPPSYLSHRHSTGSAPLPYQQHLAHSRPSFHSRGHTRSHRGPPDYLSPAYQADNDAALRASLTTLLSCAAAARGLPKHEERRNTAPGAVAGAGVVPSNQPMELRLVPESELMTGDAPAQQQQLLRGGARGPSKPATRTESNSSAPSAPPSSASSRDERHAERAKRAAKKKRTSSAAAAAAATADADATPFLASVVSPTLLPWVVSAGLVVLVSVVGFGAGYVIGREVGRQEGAASSVFGLADSAGNASSAAGCGGEVVRFGPVGSTSTGGTLRRLRWGDVVGRSVVA
ncbi:hypothetical protein VTJ83DRAFT_2180 [Remersonia thermophila]|uniref:Uncharacterized protein n=1 Tax=Remersonia thermophila TaxID=72144 RepID=A0ABR4DI90_9PEZI